MVCSCVVSTGYSSPISNFNTKSTASRDMRRYGRDQTALTDLDQVLCHEQGPPGCQSFAGSFQPAVGEQNFTTAPLSSSFSPDSTLLHLPSLDSYDSAQVSKVSTPCSFLPSMIPSCSWPRYQRSVLP